MSSFRTPRLPTTGKSRMACLRFWSLIIIGSAWVDHATLGTPGEPRRGKVPGAIRCPACGAIAKRKMTTGLYRCKNKHESRRLDDGTIERVR
jgi:hypothetical protein